MSGTRLIYSETIPPKAAAAWTVDAGQIIRITDIEGGQVGDLVLFAREDLRERNSISWTRTRNIRNTSTYEPPLGLAPGNTIWSTGYRALATVVEDTSPVKGVHDLYGLFANGWGVGDLPGGVGIHQKRWGVLHNRLLISDIGGRRTPVEADPCAHVREVGRPR